MSDISQQMAEWGRRGGQSRSDAKRKASIANAAKARAALVAKALKDAEVPASTPRQVVVVVAPSNHKPKQEPAPIFDELSQLEGGE
jgi:hypothetical protein